MLLRKVGLALALLCCVGLFACRSTQKKNEVVFETTLGGFSVELYAKEAPVSVKNFLSYVNSGFYDGIIFHRVIDGFMVQVGGFTADMQRKPVQAAIKNESSNGLKNTIGALSMARTGHPDSATSQFFINLVDNVALDPKGGRPGYAVFGKISAGMDVVAEIGRAKTGSDRGMQNVPLTPVVVNRAHVKN